MVDPSTLITTGVTVALFGALFAFRIYRMITGTLIQTGRLIAFAVVFVALFAFVVAGAYAVLPWYALVLDAVIVVVAAVATLPHVRRTVKIERRGDGQWYYTMGVTIPLVYIVLFLVRIVIDAVVLNISFAGPMTFPTLSGPELLALVVVDALFAVSTGLLVARSVGVYQEYRVVAARTPAPLPTGPVPPP